VKLMDRRSRLVLLLVAASSYLFAVACNTGSYPLDVFPEMHYQPSYRALEPERLTPPDGAVPIDGAPPALTYAQATNLSNPIARTPEGVDRARQVYLVNCAACHGPSGDGQGSMTRYYVGNPTAPVPPVDFTAARVQARTDGQLWWIIRNGLGNMPPYEDLLADDEVWLTVQFIRDVQGR
jgi:mono/diheme cytochrome c family protein